MKNLLIAATIAGSVWAGSSHAQQPATIEWNGTYSCIQGQTALHLITRSLPDGQVQALFEFGPTAANPTVPRGSFELRGTQIQDVVQLAPYRWVSAPNGYVTVGMYGLITGNTFHGTITGGYDCGPFTLQRTSVETEAARPVPSAPAARPTPVRPLPGRPLKNPDYGIDVR